MFRINCPAATCSFPGSRRGWVQGQEKHWHEKLCEIQPEGGVAGESRLTRGRKMHRRSLDVRGQSYSGEKQSKQRKRKIPLKESKLLTGWLIGGPGEGDGGKAEWGTAGKTMWVKDLGAACCPGLPQRMGKRPGGRGRNRAGRGEQSKPSPGPGSRREGSPSACCFLVW